MINQHPITPLPELVQQWIKECDQSDDPRWQEYEQDIANRAAQWGADRELEACCAWLAEDHPYVSDDLRAARRPKAPSLAEEALIEFDSLLGDSDDAGAAVILRALESLQELEGVTSR